jgi:hypothetical protein
METKPKTTRKTPAKKSSANVTEATKSTDAVAPITKKISLELPKFNMNELCEVTSAFLGQIVYVSRSGYYCAWADYGITQYIPMSELIIMRNEQPKFFSIPLVKLTGERGADAIRFLQLERYCLPINGIEDIDEIFQMEPDEVGDVIAKLTDPMKENVARRAYVFMKEGKLDSKKMIDAIAAATGFELEVDDD